MTNLTKITLTSARDIPLNKLVLSQKNVRRIKAGVSIEQLAADIAHRGLLQSLNVRPILDDEGKETGSFEVPAGGRRLAALQLLAKQKRIAKNQPVPCIARTEGLAEEDSLAENTMREELHPLDQFRAFKALVDQGLSEDDVAARFFVSTLVVKQRLKLASVSPKLLELYASGEMALDQLTAFSVSPDHAQQEQVWETVCRGWNKAPYVIKNMLTQDQVPGDDRRALFVGTEAYEAAGGVILRDLFSQDGKGGWFREPALLNRLAAEKLQSASAELLAEGWKWVETALSFPYGHTSGLRRVSPAEVSADEQDTLKIEALRAEYDRLQADHEGDDDLSEEVDARLAAIEGEIEAFEAKCLVFTPEVKATAGVFVSLGYDGSLNVERGLVRPENVQEEPNAERRAPAAGEDDAHETSGGVGEDHSFRPFEPAAGPSQQPEDEDPDRPISDRLMLELTTVRRLALRDVLADDPDAAFLAVLHAMVLKLFYATYRVDTCLELQARTTDTDRSIEGLDAFAPAASMLARKENWSRQLPEEPNALWDFLLDLHGDSRASLFALCAALSVNAIQEPYVRRPDAIAHAGRLAERVGLDLAQTWEPTAQNFFSKVTKGRILNAVREGKSEHAAQLIDHLKKADMAREAERLLAGSGWLPQPMRTPGFWYVKEPAVDESASDADAMIAEAGSTESVTDLPTFLTDNDPAADGDDTFAHGQEDQSRPAPDGDYFDVAAE